MSARKSGTYVLRLHRVIFPGSLRPQGFLSRLQSSKTIILYGGLSYFFFPPLVLPLSRMADRGAFRFIRAQWWSYTFPCFHAITIFSRDLTSDWLRSQSPLHFHLAALLCASTPQYVHTRSIQLCSPSVSVFLSFPVFLTPFFNMPRIQLGCQPDFRRDYVLHCLFDIICLCIYSSRASTIVFAHARSLAFTRICREHESNEMTKYQNKMVDLP